MCEVKDKGREIVTNPKGNNNLRPISRLQIRVTKMLQTKIKVFRIGDSRTRYHCFQLLLAPTKIQYPKNHFPETLLNFSLVLHLRTPRLAEKLLNKSCSLETS